MSINEVIERHVAVQCTTLDKAKNFLQVCENLGFNWVCDGPKATVRNFWREARSRTCYVVENTYLNKGIWHNSVSYMQSKGIAVVNFDDIIF